MQMWLGWLLGSDTRCFWKHRVSTQLSGWETECLQDTGFAGIRARFIQMWLGWPVGPDTRCFWKHRVSNEFLVFEPGLSKCGWVGLLGSDTRCFWKHRVSNEFLGFEPG